ncbi:alpha/beta fold hydrolase [Nocardioides immobilis]|uniref:alpha/beta fold hydrolase n=1 Tax=Nocardioides immobilis TaxID=2049295 RepID=UPI0015FB2A06|nr:alpha/beta fold hydrolase [Nocardioides immobilis]
MKPDLTFSHLAGGAELPHLLVVGPSLGTAVTALWGECASLLGDRFEVVGWDLPGHGSSPAAAGPYSVADLSDVVRDRAAELADGRPATYAGVSLGGVVGFELAARPGPFAAVASIAATPRIGEPGAWHERAALVRRAGTPALVASSATRWFAPAFTDRRPEVTAALLTSLSHADPRSYAWACEALAALERAEVTASRPLVPLLVLAGEHDVVVPPAAAESATSWPLRADFEVLTGCGHLPPAEDPAATAAAVAGFLVGQEAAR